VFVNFLLGFVIFILILRLVFRYLLPILFKKFLRSQQNRFKQHFHKYQNSHTKNDGDITINKKVKKKNTKDNLGEYVDFEEIEDN